MNALRFRFRASFDESQGTLVARTSLPRYHMKLERHVTDRPPEPQHQVGRAVGRRQIASENRVAVLAAIFFSAITVGLGAAFGFVFLQPSAAAASGDLPEALMVYDAAWYREIAVHGYSYVRGQRSSVAFFPLYPLTARAASAVLRLRTDLALLLVSNASLVAAMVIFDAYARGRLVNRSCRVAQYSVAAALLFPTSCFFRFAYSESTFALFSVLPFLMIQRQWPPWSVAIVVGAATATRPVGIALLAPLWLFAWERYRTEVSRLWILPLVMSLGCWGIASYAAFQWIVFGEPFAFVHAQREWTVRPLPALAEHLFALATLEPIRAVYNTDSPAYWAREAPLGVAWFSIRFANPILFVATLLVLGLGAFNRWLTRSEMTLGVLLLVVPYITRGYEMGMGSTGRFAAVVFPLYLVLGQILARLPTHVAAVLLGLSACLMAIYSALYVAGDHVF